MIQRISDDMLWSQIVARAWCDEEFMKRLRSEPRAVLAEHGLELPHDKIELIEGPEAGIEDDENDLIRFVLPANPPDDLVEEDLVATGAGWYCGACGRCGACGCRCRC